MSTFDLMILLNVVQLNVVLLNALAPKLTTERVKSYDGRKKFCEYRPWLYLKPAKRLGQGSLTRRGRLSTIDLLIKIGCFEQKEKNIVSVCWSEQVSTRRSTVQSLPVRWGFLGGNTVKNAFIWQETLTTDVYGLFSRCLCFNLPNNFWVFEEIFSLPRWFSFSHQWKPLASSISLVL